MFLRIMLYSSYLFNELWYYIQTLHNIIQILEFRKNLNIYDIFIKNSLFPNKHPR